MFGESESESPRTGSPWDGLLSRSDPASPAVEPARSPGIVPKLVPEVEEGNVEYKLRLLNPTAERFTRLVTQLKWRLLEGGGQAYYELGVADSGQLVGLSRTHLEQSLQTLEEMAGEIGASVIVVKEIELPAALLETNKEEGPRGKIADGAMRMSRVRVSDYVETSPSSAGADEESELSTPEGVDETSPGVFIPRQPGIVCSRSVGANDEACNSTGSLADLEIASVYKPRPHRRRPPRSNASPSKPARPSSNDSFALDLAALHAPSSPMDVPNQVTSARKAEKWRKKDLKRLSHTPVSRFILDGDELSGADSRPPSVSSGVDTIGTSDHLKALDDLEVAAALLSLDDSPPCECVPDSNGSSGSEAANSPIGNGNGNGNGSGETCSDVMQYGVLKPDDPTERRYIVEALVLRKMSLEDSFLDFVNI